MSGPEESASERAELLAMLRRTGAVRRGSFTLSSGGTSDVYVDIKRAWPDPAQLSLLAAALARRVDAEDRLAGLELGAVPLVVATALACRRPYLVLRKAAKEHGTRQRWEGDLPTGARVLLIEDVTTTGRSVADSVDVLRGAGAKVERVLTVVDRSEGAADRLALQGVRLEWLFTLSDLRSPDA